ncbi:MAG TPA: hypothetical protein VML75_05080 [Kofleriaceae bacterium]|nr:hypothetical protein [Kofleriaceae bacterium]
MRIASGKVIDGRVVVEGEPLIEGATVTVLALEDDEEFELEATAHAELLAALEEAERGQGVDGESFLDQLDPR